MDTPELSIRELDALFNQSPVAMAFVDVQLRTRRANAAFNQLTGLSGEDLLGRSPSQVPGADRLVDTHFVERTLAEQVISKGIPVVNMPLERKGVVLAWTAYRVTDNDQVLGAVSALVDITASARADMDLRQANTRLDLLQRAGTEIGSTLDVRRTAEELATLAVPGLADRINVDLLDPSLQDVDLSHADLAELRFHRYAIRDVTRDSPINYAVGDPITMQITRRPAVAFLRGEPVLARNPDEMRQSGLAANVMQGLFERGVHSFISAPLMARGVTLGVVGFSRAENPDPYDEADVRLVSDLAARAAVHIDNARLYTREHDAAVTLQRSLLPRDIPQVPGLDIAYRYLPARRANEIGGDWFDVIPLEGGQVSLAVGDVTGHGIRAAAIMGQLRTTTAALVRLGCPPEQVLDQLDTMVSAHGVEAGATCVHAQYDLRSRRCQLVSAGHPPPALRGPDGATEFIEVPGGLMLGAGPGRHPTVDRDLPPGSVLALYTDGLIEQPGEDLAIGMSRLARALSDGPTSSLDELCDSVLTSLAPHPRDDVALLLARPT